jgi:hypothetical protein
MIIFVKITDVKLPFLRAIQTGLGKFLFLINRLTESFEFRINELIVRPDRKSIIMYYESSIFATINHS